MALPACSLCESDGGVLLHRAKRYRVVRADEAGFPAFYRVVWNEHVAEFSDLPAKDRYLCMDAVVAVEEALRQQLQPDKINVASLGNMVPHLHWHVIARFAWDSHFPSPVWAGSVRETPQDACVALAGKLDAAEALMLRKLRALDA